MSATYSTTGLLLFASLLLPTTSTAAESGSIPSDFKLCAEFRPGYSDWKDWKVTVSADGKAFQETAAPWVGNGAASEKTLTLTTKEVEELVTTVRASKFFTLKKRYAYAVTDSATLILRVTMNGNLHEVEVYAPYELKDNEEVKRFLKVWNEVLRKVPSPNAQQKPE